VLLGAPKRPPAIVGRSLDLIRRCGLRRQYAGLSRVTPGFWPPHEKGADCRVGNTSRPRSNRLQPPKMSELIFPREAARGSKTALAKARLIAWLLNNRP
jgi:hypothetical protein